MSAHPQDKMKKTKKYASPGSSCTDLYFARSLGGLDVFKYSNGWCDWNPLRHEGNLGGCAGKKKAVHLCVLCEDLAESEMPSTRWMIAR